MALTEQSRAAAANERSLAMLSFALELPNGKNMSSDEYEDTYALLA